MRDGIVDSDAADTFGRWLKARRAALGMTQHELAERTSIDVRLISRYEKGGVVPRKGNEQLLREALVGPGPDEAAPPTRDAPPGGDEQTPPEMINDEETLQAVAGMLASLVGSGAAKVLVAWKDENGLAAIAEAPDKRLVTIHASASSSTLHDIESLRVLVDRLSHRLRGQRAAK